MFTSRVKYKLLMHRQIESGFKEEFENYIQLLDTPQVKTLGELIAFNKAHADKELPQGKCWGT